MMLKRLAYSMSFSIYNLVLIVCLSCSFLHISIWSCIPSLRITAGRLIPSRLIHRYYCKNNLLMSCQLFDWIFFFPFNQQFFFCQFPNFKPVHFAFLFISRLIVSSMFCVLVRVTNFPASWLQTLLGWISVCNMGNTYHLDSLILNFPG